MSVGAGELIVAGGGVSVVAGEDSVLIDGGGGEGSIAARIGAGGVVRVAGELSVVSDGGGGEARMGLRRSGGVASERTGLRRSGIGPSPASRGSEGPGVPRTLRRRRLLARGDVAVARRVKTNATTAATITPRTARRGGQRFSFGRSARGTRPTQDASTSAPARCSRCNSSTWPARAATQAGVAPDRAWARFTDAPWRRSTETTSTELRLTASSNGKPRSTSAPCLAKTSTVAAWPASVVVNFASPKNLLASVLQAASDFF